MSDTIFAPPAGLKWDLIKRPIWSTLKQAAASQREVRVGLVSYPLYQVEINFEVLREGLGFSELQSLIGHFNAMRGDWDDWLILDEDDNAVANQQFGIGDGTTTVFQLYRTYAGVSEPVFGKPTVTQATVNGTPTAVSVSSWGKVTFGSPPANGAVLRWTGSYYLRVRFATPQQDFKRFLQYLWEARAIKLITVKP